MPRYESRRGESLYYAWYPNGPGRPVLCFFNGTGQCTANWQHIRRLMGKEASVLLYDAKGQGRSSKGEEFPSLEGHVRDAAELLRHLGISGGNLVGVSHGGHVALALAGEHPELVRSVTVSGLGSEYGPRVRLILSSWIGILQEQGLAAWARAALPLVFGESFLQASQGVLQEMEASLVRRNDASALIRHMQALLQYPHPRVQAEAIHCPARVLAGDDDPLLRSGQAERLAGICGTEVRRFPGAGHTLPAEVPRDFVVCLREWLE